MILRAPHQGGMLLWARPVPVPPVRPLMVTECWWLSVWVPDVNDAISRVWLWLAPPVSVAWAPIVSECVCPDVLPPTAWLWSMFVAPPVPRLAFRFAGNECWWGVPPPVVPP